MNEERFEKEIQKAIEHAKKIKQKQELYELRHSNDKPKKELTTGKKVLYFMISNCSLIEIYSLVVMILFADLSSLPLLITAVVAECISVCGYFVKSTKENTEHGIVYETAMKKLEYELNNKEDKDAVG